MSLLRHRALSLKAGGAYDGFDPVLKGANATLQNSDFDVYTSSSGVKRWALSVGEKAAGKWRAQFVVVAQSNTDGVGVATGTALGDYAGGNTQATALFGNYGSALRRYYNGSAAATYTLTYGNGTLIDVYVDIDNGRVWWAVNGTIVAGDPAAGTGAMFTFTPGAPIRLAADVTGAGGLVRIRTDPAQFSGAGIAGFNNGWPT